MASSKVFWEFESKELDIEHHPIPQMVLSEKAILVLYLENTTVIKREAILTFVPTNLKPADRKQVAEITIVVETEKAADILAKPATKALLDKTQHII